MTADELFVLCLDAGFPTDACRALSEDYRKMRACPACADLLDRYADDYENERPFSFGDAQGKVSEAAQNAGVHPYAAEFLFYCTLLPTLKKRYEREGLPECFRGALEDLSCKLSECRRVYDLWGSFVAIWFALFFEGSLYTFGRLEFCLCRCPCDFSAGGRSIGKGQFCIDVHIPSKGRLTRADLDDAYARAADFFAPRLEGAPVVFRCHSWLLADYHEKMLPPDSGILLFARDYTLVARTGDEGDLWRIFGSAAFGEIADLPEDTLLQREYKKRLLAGEPLYGGEGLFFYVRPGV